MNEKKANDKGQLAKIIAKNKKIVTKSPVTSSNSNQPWRQNMVLDIVDKQYRLYSWSDAKTSSLITTNSILLAVIGFIFKESLADTFTLVCVFFSVILVGLSLYYSLKQVIPQGSSGRSKSSKPNIRALSGILDFDNWQAYDKAIENINEREYLEANKPMKL